MEVFDGHRALFRPLAAPAVALGNFDGVHRGHQALLAAARAAADRLGGDAVVYTFDPHPAQILAPSKAPPLLTHRDRKLELLAEAGVDVCILEPFTPELAHVSPAAFVDDILVGVVGVRHAVVGYDFHYGHNRGGTPDTLRAHGARADFAVEVIEPVSVDGDLASSTAIRARIRTGDMPGARALLGRDYDVGGSVVRGAGRGRQIGVPTANLDPDGALLPATGIYAVWVDLLDALDRRRVAGAASLGTNPTFDTDGAVTLEVHLLDFDEDLYGHRLRVHFVERLRGEERFDSVDALVAQIRDDVARTRGILGARPAS